MWFLRNYHEAIEFDLGWDTLKAFYKGRVTPRQLLVKITRLPRTSATMRAISPEATAWSTTDYLLAGVIDVLATANWQRSGDKNAPRPIPVERPNAEREQRKQEFRTRVLQLRELRQRQVNDD